MGLFDWGFLPGDLRLSLRAVTCRFEPTLGREADWRNRRSAGFLKGTDGRFSAKLPPTSAANPSLPPQSLECYHFSARTSYPDVLIQCKWALANTKRVIFAISLCNGWHLVTFTVANFKDEKTVASCYHRTAMSHRYSTQGPIARVSEEDEMRLASVNTIHGLGILNCTILQPVVLSAVSPINGYRFCGKGCSRE